MFLPFSKLLATKIWTAMGKYTLWQKDWEINIVSFKTNRILSSPLQYMPSVLGRTWKLVVEVQNQTFQGCFDRVRLERSQENLSYSRGFGFRYQPQKDIFIQLSLLGMELCCIVILAWKKTTRAKKKAYFKNTFSSIISVLNKYITCFVR